jgi:hypothetical protein
MSDTERFIRAKTRGNYGLAPRGWLLTLAQIQALPEVT